MSSLPELIEEAVAPHRERADRAERRAEQAEADLQQKNDALMRVRHILRWRSDATSHGICKIVDDTLASPGKNQT